MIYQNSRKLKFQNEKRFKKSLSKIPSMYKKQLKKKLPQLLDNGPSYPAMKKLVNSSLAEFRRRIGNYRILINIDQERRLITLLSIIHRKNAYMHS